MALTPASLLARIRNMSGETDTFWSDGEVFAYMTEAEQIITNRIPCNQDSTTVASVANQRQYDLPDNAKAIKRVEYNGLKLKNIDMNQIEGLEYPQADSSTSGTPTNYYLWGETFNASPVPDHDSTNFTLFFTTQTTADYSSATPSFNIPGWLAFYTADYALYRMYAKDDEMKKSAVMYETRWERDLVEIEHTWNQRQTGDQYMVVKDVDDYPNGTLGLK